MPENKKIGFKTRIIANFLLFFSRSRRKTSIILLYAIFAMVTWKSIPVFEPHLIETKYSCAVTRFFLNSSKIWGSFLLFGIVPLGLIKFLFRERISDYGFRWGNLRRGLAFFVITVPLMVWFAYLAGTNSNFLKVYPYNPSVLANPSIFPIYAISYCAYYFGWEFFFRGFLQNGLRGNFGIGNAILIQTLASTLLHIGHPTIEIFASIFAGIFWGIVAYRTRSILSGFLQHASLGIMLDWFLIRFSTGT